MIYDSYYSIYSGYSIYSSYSVNRGYSVNSGYRVGGINGVDGIENKKSIKGGRETSFILFLEKNEYWIMVYSTETVLRLKNLPEEKKSHSTISCIPFVLTMVIFTLMTPWFSVIVERNCPNPFCMTRISDDLPSSA